MDVHLITDGGVEERTLEDLPEAPVQGTVIAP